MAKKIFILSFFIAALTQWFSFAELSMFDFSMWADQAKYVQTNNPIQFDFLQAYGHPGGPIIEGVIFVHSVFNLDYEDSLMLFMVFVDGLAIALTAVLCYLYRKNHLWWPVVLIGLSLNRMYGFSTPPSTMVSIFIGLLSIYSLYIYQKNTIKPIYLGGLSLILGIIISLRIDIGCVMALSTLVFLYPKLTWKHIIFTILGTGGFIVLFDPFLWFMPIQHIKDLWFKITYHYEEFKPTKISFYSLQDISALSFFSIFLAMTFVFLKKKLKSPLPYRFIYIYLFTTIVLYTIFLTSNYQAERYFLPLVTIWQIFLPLFIFTITEYMWPKLSKKINIPLSVFLGIYPVVLLAINYLVLKSYNL